VDLTEAERLNTLVFDGYRVGQEVIEPPYFDAERELLFVASGTEMSRAMRKNPRISYW